MSTLFQNCSFIDPEFSVWLFFIDLILWNIFSILSFIFFECIKYMIIKAVYGNSNIWKPHESVYSAFCLYWYFFFTNRKILIMCVINFILKLDSKLKIVERIWGLEWFVFLLWGFAFPSELYLAIQNNLNWILRPEMIWGARAGTFLNSLSVLLFRVPVWIMRTYQSPPL